MFTRCCMLPCLRTSVNNKLWTYVQFCTSQLRCQCVHLWFPPLHKVQLPRTRSCLKKSGSSRNGRLMIYSQLVLGCAAVTVEGIRFHSDAVNACREWRQHVATVSSHFPWPCMGNCSCFVATATGVIFRGRSRKQPKQQRTGRNVNKPHLSPP